MDTITLKQEGLDPSTFVNVLGSFGGWIGSATVQHLTGLTLTQPLVSCLGPVGLIGSFGIYQAGLKAVLSPSSLRAFGWNRDQTPARGIAEALTTAATEQDTIHFGFPLNRQQTHIIPVPEQDRVQKETSKELTQQDTLVPHDPKPDDKKRWMQRAGGTWTKEGSWETLFSDEKLAANTKAVEFQVRVAGVNKYVRNASVISGDIVTPSVYHSNVTWLGRREGAFIKCSDQDDFNRRLCASFVMTILLTYGAMAGMMVGEVLLIGPGRTDVVAWQVIFYGAMKATAIFVLHLRFFLLAWVTMPGKPCTSKDGSKFCHPARIRIYRQKFEGASSGMCTSAAVYCERSYRLVQGIDHPALATRIHETKRSFFRAGGFNPASQDSSKVRPYCMPLRRGIMTFLDLVLASLSIAFLFAYALYIAFLAVNANAGADPRAAAEKEKKVLGWMGAELGFLALKMILLTGPYLPARFRAIATFPIKHGKEVDLTFNCSNSSKNTLCIKNKDLIDGRLIDADWNHVVYQTLLVKYKSREVWTRVHMELRPQPKKFTPKSEGRDEGASPQTSLSEATVVSSPCVDKKPMLPRLQIPNKEPIMQQTPPQTVPQQPSMRITVPPLFVFLTVERGDKKEKKFINCLVNSVIPTEPVKIPYKFDMHNEEASLNVAWCATSKKVWLGRKAGFSIKRTSDQRAEEPQPVDENSGKTKKDSSFEALSNIDKHFQRTLTFSMTKVKTLTGQNKDVLDIHTRLEPLVLTELSQWVQLNDKAREGVDWEREDELDSNGNAKVTKVCMLGANSFTGVSLSSDQGNLDESLPSCLCGRDTW